MYVYMYSVIVFKRCNIHGVLFSMLMRPAGVTSSTLVSVYYNSTAMTLYYDSTLFIAVTEHIDIMTCVHGGSYGICVVCPGIVHIFDDM